MTTQTQAPAPESSVPAPEATLAKRNGDGNEPTNIGLNWLKWRLFLEEPHRIGGFISCSLGSLLLASVMASKYGFLGFFGTLGLFLLGSSRVFRNLLVVVLLLGTSCWGFSHVLRHVWEPGHMAPAKATIMIAVILAWTILVAMCLGRLNGRRDDE